MDPVGPWSAYASYNRLAGVQAGAAAAAAGEFHHSLATHGPHGPHGVASGVGSGAPSTTGQLLLQAAHATVSLPGQLPSQFNHGGFLSPPPVGYDVFTPLFHHSHSHSNPKPAHYAHHRQQAAKQAAAEAEYATFFEQTPSSAASVASAAWQGNGPFGILPHESVVPSSPTKPSATTAYDGFNVNVHFQSQPNQPNQPSQPDPGKGARSGSPQTAPSTKPPSAQPSASASASAPSQPPSQPPAQAFFQAPPTFGSGPESLAGYKSTPIPVPAAQEYAQGGSKCSPGSSSHLDRRSRIAPSSAPRSPDEKATEREPDCAAVAPRRPSPLLARSQASPLGPVPSPAYPAYNSPMNHSEPVQSQTTHRSIGLAAPASPSDASTPQSRVAYPSVITRALSAERTDDKRFESSPGGPWNDERKYRNSPGCQSDSIGVVKCSQASEQRKNVAKVVGHGSLMPKNNFRRKSNDKQSTVETNLNNVASVPMSDYFTGRIPPPAHSSTANHQQNGAYLEFERWNLPPPPPKMFTGPAAFGTSAFVNQPQSLTVPHPHSHPSLPYFAAFHLPPHSSEYQSSVEISPVNAVADSTHTTSSFLTAEIRDGEQPKVVVPNIEEELGFLTEQRTNSTVQSSPAAIHPPPSSVNGPQEIVSKVPDKKLTVPVTSAGSSFMASYLKFLQGERDKSPPPVTRGGRKASWSRSNAPNNKSFNDHSTAKNSDQSSLHGQNLNGAMPPSCTMNSVPMNAPGVLSPACNVGSPGNINPAGNIGGVGVMSSSGAMIAPLPTVSKLGDPHQDDPRYFSAAKDRKRKFEVAHEGFDNNDEESRRLNKPVLNVPSAPINEKGKKGRANANKGPVTAPVPQNAVAPKKSRPAAQPPPLPAMQAQSHQQYYYQQPDEASDPLVMPQRREPSRRKAKEKANIAELISNNDADDPEEPQEFVDSDSDPAWNPSKGDEGGEIGVISGKNKKLKRSRPVTGASRARNRGMSNILSAAAHGAGIDYTDYSSEDESSASKKLNQHRVMQQPAIVQQNMLIKPSEEMPYQSGEFVAIKSDLHDAWPPIWRVDGKTLLQKFDPFEQNGKVLYRNISTYAAWNSDNKKLYTQVPAKVRAQNHLETIVEFMRNEIVIDDNDFIEKRIQDTVTYQDNFEVYIQTLISHALDPNFLTEIFQEQDEYFLTNVKTVDELTEDRRRRIAAAGTIWSRGLEAAVSTWPCLNVIDLSPPLNAPVCTSCRLVRSTQRIQLYGQPYNPATLESCQPDPRIPYEKDIYLCRPCGLRVELYSRISHQKYLMYIECNKRVAEKRAQDPHKDTTIILNELLADEPWLSQLFREVRQSWAEAESLERKCRLEVTRQLV